MRRWSLLLALAACSTERSALHPSGPAARLLADLGWPILVFFTVTSVAMWALVAWVATRRTGTLLEHDGPDAKGGQKWVVYGGFVVPGVAFSAIFVATLRTMSAFPMDHHQHHGADIRVVGHQWWWEVQYVRGSLNDFVATANEIHVPAGQQIDVELVSADVIHSLWAPRLHGKVDLIPGMDNFIRLQADRPGVYEGGCAEFCGLEHAVMRFKVIADEPAKFEQWLAHQREPAPEPSSAEARRGKELFEHGACALCHTVRGTVARATVGPDLTHLAGRSTIAAYLPRDVADLHAWIVNAPSLKPGTQMPALTHFTGEELHDLVDYLQTLK
ncbi:MAG: cytochrome c oxidase subunit II [Myxococcales bacterium]|nr:cytochrome c oxidase subunit II [Myxococcales bacterium]